MEPAKLSQHSLPPEGAEVAESQFKQNKMEKESRSYGSVGIPHFTSSSDLQSEKGVLTSAFDGVSNLPCKSVLTPFGAQLQTVDNDDLISVASCPGMKNNTQTAVNIDINKLTVPTLYLSKEKSKTGGDNFEPNDPSGNFFVCTYNKPACNYLDDDNDDDNDDSSASGSSCWYEKVPNVTSRLPSIPLDATKKRVSTTSEESQVDISICQLNQSQSTDPALSGSLKRKLDLEGGGVHSEKKVKLCDLSAVPSHMETDLSSSKNDITVCHEERSETGCRFEEDEQSHSEFGHKRTISQAHFDCEQECLNTGNSVSQICGNKRKTESGSRSNISHRSCSTEDTENKLSPVLKVPCLNQVLREDACQNDTHQSQGRSTLSQNEMISEQSDSSNSLSRVSQVHQNSEEEEEGNDCDKDDLSMSGFQDRCIYNSETGDMSSQLSQSDNSEAEIETVLGGDETSVNRTSAEKLSRYKQIYDSDSESDKLSSDHDVGDDEILAGSSDYETLGKSSDSETHYETGDKLLADSDDQEMMSRKPKLAADRSVRTSDINQEAQELPMLEKKKSRKQLKPRRILREGFLDTTATEVDVTMETEMESSTRKHEKCRKQSKPKRVITGSEMRAKSKQVMCDSEERRHNKKTDRNCTENVEDLPKDVDPNILKIGLLPIAWTNGMLADLTSKQFKVMPHEQVAEQTQAKLMENLAIVKKLREIRVNRYRKISMSEKKKIAEHAKEHGVSMAAHIYGVSKSAVSMWTRMEFNDDDDEMGRRKKNCMLGNEKFESLVRRVKHEKTRKFKGLTAEDKYEVVKYAKLVGVREMARCLDVALGTVSGWMRQFPYRTKEVVEGGQVTKNEVNNAISAPLDLSLPQSTCAESKDSGNSRMNEQFNIPETKLTKPQIKPESELCNEIQIKSEPSQNLGMVTLETGETCSVSVKSEPPEITVSKVKESKVKGQGSKSARSESPASCLSYGLSSAENLKHDTLVIKREPEDELYSVDEIQKESSQTQVARGDNSIKTEDHSKDVSNVGHIREMMSKPEAAEIENVQQLNLVLPNMDAFENESNLTNVKDLVNQVLNDNIPAIQNIVDSALKREASADSEKNSELENCEIPAGSMNKSSMTEISELEVNICDSDRVDQLIQESMVKPDPEECFKKIKDQLEGTCLENDTLFETLHKRVTESRIDKYKTLKASEKLEVVRFAKRIGVRRVAKLMDLATGTLSGWITKYQHHLGLEPDADSLALLDSSSISDADTSVNADAPVDPDSSATQSGGSKSPRSSSILDNQAEKMEVTAIKFLLRDQFPVLLSKIRMARSLKFKNVTHQDKLEIVKCAKLVGIRPTARVFNFPLGTLSGWISKYEQFLEFDSIPSDVEADSSVVDLSVPSQESVSERVHSKDWGTSSEEEQEQARRLMAEKALMMTMPMPMPLNMPMPYPMENFGAMVPPRLPYIPFPTSVTVSEHQ